MTLKAPALDYTAVSGQEVPPVCVCVRRWETGGRRLMARIGWMTQSQRWSDVRAHVCLIKSDTSFHPSLPSSFWLRWRTRCPPLFHLTGSKSAGRLSHFGTHRSQTGRFSNVSNSPSPPASSFQQLNNDADFYFNAALKTSQLPWCQNGSEIHSDSCFLCLSLLFCAALHHVGNNKLGRKIVNFFFNLCLTTTLRSVCLLLFHFRKPFQSTFKFPSAAE